MILPKRAVRCVRLAATEDAGGPLLFGEPLFRSSVDGTGLCRSFRGKNLSRHSGIRGNSLAALSKGACGVHRGIPRTKLKSSTYCGTGRQAPPRIRPPAHGYSLARMPKKQAYYRCFESADPATRPPSICMRSFGFRQAGKRRGHYQDTGEDALILYFGYGTDSGRIHRITLRGRILCAPLSPPTGR